MKARHLMLWLITLASPVSAIGQQAIITSQPSADTINLASSSTSVQIIVDRLEWPAVARAVKDLALDFGRVTGLNGSVHSIQALNGSSFSTSSLKPWTNSTTSTLGGVIIVGTLGRSSIIDQLVRSGKIQTKSISGQWESFISTIVETPVPGLSRALVIAGSDRRGSVYGLYDISEQIGVSPWHWFADVPSKRHDTIYALNITKTQRSPSVKYRGFFINDEAPALTGWINAKYGKSKHESSFGSEFYSQVFELLLRLRANYLWPAMWGSAFNIDDPRNQALAHEYGIVMGTSHTEPMMRATEEQTKFMTGPWQWDVNNASMHAFMLEGAQRAKEYESVFTMGARGNHDTALNGGNAKKQLEGIFKSQREILGEVYGDAKKVPQVWTLYTEVQSYYDDEGLEVPEDVTLLWADDNFGNMRRLPVARETNRSGGAGVYYHFDFVGPPRCYKWINTIQLQKTWEQMSMAYQRQARKIWMVNVGDIKGMEIPTNHFFDLAYDMTLYTQPNSTAWWLQQWAGREFGKEQADIISTIMMRYSNLAGKRKFELVETSTYSIINYDEGDAILAEWRGLSKDAQTVYDKLADEAQPAFFEMALHPILAGGNHHEITIGSAKNQLYAFQGRNSANTIAEHVLSRWEYDRTLKKRYDELLGGKWKHMMDQTHFYNNYWQQPMRDMSPQLHYIQPFDRSLSGDMGIAIEGTNASIPGDDQFHVNSGTSLTMLPISSFGKPRWIDVFAQGTNNFTFNIATESFVTVKPNSGTISPTGNGSDTRIRVSIDWSKAPLGSGTTRINITSSTDYGTQYSSPYLILPYNNHVLPPSFKKGFVESDCTVSIEAEHYSIITQGTTPSLTYTTIAHYGKTLSGVALSNVNAPSLSITTAPNLEYNFYSFTSIPLANISLILSPSLNTAPGHPLRYAIAIDDRTPQVVQFVRDKSPEAQKEGWPNGMPFDWEKAVMDACWTSKTRWGFDGGAHRIRFWALESGVVLQKIVVDLGGVRESYLGPPASMRIGF